MTLELSEAAANAMLDVLSALMDGGSIELQSEDTRVLAVLKLSNPATEPAVDGELEFNEISIDVSARAQGNATTARILSADGREIVACDVGDENSTAVIKLSTTKINRGVPVRLESFRLVMP